jgi:hypothetical protein
MQEECEANARLIAAAPELLDALKDVLIALEDPQSSVTMSVLHNAQNVIAKAEGREVPA